MTLVATDVPAARPSGSGRITGILLSAGLGTRFGGDKCLAALPSGVAMGLQSARNLAPAAGRLVCVVRDDDEALRRLYVDAGFEVARCTDARRGISASLRTGIEAAGDAEGWLIALADMPWINPDTCRVVARALVERGGIVAPTHQGQRGHPVGISARFGPALRSLTGDSGARQILNRYADDVSLVEVGDRGILLDIDQTGDLQCAPLPISCCS